MMQHAYFDADGACLCVADMPMEVPPGGCSRLVPMGTEQQSICLVGDRIEAAVPCGLLIPDMLEVASSTLQIELPAGVVAIVDGTRQVEQLALDRRVEREFHIVFRGKMSGRRIVRVQSYAAQRREAYPAIGDQLDALWKGFEALSKAAATEAVSVEASAMLEQIEAVKASIPKDVGA
jgi:hypothetical protein